MSVVFAPETRLSERGVYAIELASGATYVGMTTVSFEKRWRSHMTMLRKGDHHCRGLRRGHAAGHSAYFRVLQYESDTEKIPALEVEWWHRLKAEGVRLLNGEPSGSGSVRHSEEARARMRELKLRSLTAEEKRLIERCVEENLSTMEIHKRFGLPKSKVYSFIAAAGLRRPWTVLTADKEERLLALAAAGKPYGEACKAIPLKRDVAREVYLAHGYLKETVLSPEEEKYIRHRRAERATNRDIATELHVPLSRVRAYSNSEGLDRPRKERVLKGRRTVTLPSDELASLYWGALFTLKEVAAHFGCSYGIAQREVAKTAERLGLPLESAAVRRQKRLGLQRAAAA